MIKEHLAGRKDVEILYSDESDGLLGTGGGVAKALAAFRAASRSSSTIRIRSGWKATARRWNA